MKTTLSSFKSLLLVGASLAALAGCECLPQENSSQQQAFATPDLAVNALITANRKGDKQAMLSILGPQAGKLVYSGDAVADRGGQQKFVAAYDKFHRIDSQGAGKDVLVVGSEQWEMPIPLVHAANGWVFDTAAGEEIILDRRIGRDELNAISVCRTYVEAQREYAALTKQTRGYREYAQHITSRPGTHDGLYWPVGPRGTQSPFGPLLSDAQAEGYGSIQGKHHPFHGYYFRILREQGAATAGGARNYVVNGHMTRGFALIAYPATYGDSGVMSFIVNQNGIVYEKDLGADTPSAAAQIQAYDPDEDWRIAP